MFSNSSQFIVLLLPQWILIAATYFPCSSWSLGGRYTLSMKTLWTHKNTHHHIRQHWHRLAFSHRKRQLYCLGRGMFALRQGQPTCITCDDECFTASYPRPVHVGRAKLPSTCLSSKVNTPACRRRLLFRVLPCCCCCEPDYVSAVCVGSELV